MLQRIRDNASGPIAYVVVAVIALVFGVWGIGSYFTPSADPTVATVGNTTITRYQLQQAYNQRYQRLRQLMGDKFDPSVVPPDQLRRTVLQGLINDAVVNQYAADAGYRVTDAGVLAALRSNPQFQDNGRFSPERYRRLLAQAGIAPAQYEANLRHDLKSRAVHTEITDSAFAAPVEVDQAYQRANEERRVRALVFDPAHYRSGIEIPDSEIQKYYDAHGERFQRPARVKLAYVDLNRQNAAGDAKADEPALKKLYEQNKTKLGTPEKRSGEEIRVPIDKDEAGARATITQLASSAGPEADFRQLAKQAGASAKYKAIDSAAQADLPAAVADAMFGLDKGEVSTPVKGDDAWYLLRVGTITKASTPDFDDPQVQAQLRAIDSASRAAQAFRDKSDKMESLAFQAPNDLDTLSDQLGLEIQHSDWISRDGGPGVGQYDAVRKAAFSDSVYKDKLNSTPIDLGAGRRVVLRVADRQPAQQRPLKAVRDRIEQQLIAEQAQQKARDAAQQALAKVKAGQADLKALAGANGSGPSLQTPGYVRRSSGPQADGDLGPQLRETAFSLAQPSQGSPRYAVAETVAGKVALVAVDDRRSGADDGQNAVPRKQFVSQQRRYVSGLEYAVFNAYLRDNADIQINQDRIN